MARRTGQYWFRLGAVVALILITAGYAYYYMAMQRPVLRTAPGPETVVRAEVLADGSVLMLGNRYSDPAKLKAKIAELQSAHPATSFNLYARPNMKFEPLGKAALLFQQSGAYKVVFVSPPKENLKEKK